MKAIFFDIDGTLISRAGVVPKSVPLAVEQLRARGNLAFICSGRTKILVNAANLSNITFDGVISGCGSLIEYRDDVLLYRTIPADLAIHALKILTANKIVPVLEGRDFMYFDESDLPFENHGAKLTAILGKKMLSIVDNFGRWQFSKFLCATDPNISDIDSCVAALSADFDFKIHNENLFEMVIKNVNKGSAIELVREKLNLAREDTFSIGDSANDVDMFRATGTAVAMANAPSAVKNAADFVTDFAENDGICLALKHFNLIDD